MLMRVFSKAQTASLWSGSQLCGRSGQGSDYPRRGFSATTPACGLPCVYFYIYIGYIYKHVAQRRRMPSCSVKRHELSR